MADIFDQLTDSSGAPVAQGDIFDQLAESPPSGLIDNLGALKDEFVETYSQPKELLKAANPYAVPFKMMDLAGRGIEAFQGATTAAFDPKTEVIPEVFRALKGGQTTGKEQFERVTGKNLDELYQQSQQKTRDILPESLAPVINAIEKISTLGGRVTPADVAGGTIELANDPMTWLGGITGLKNIFKPKKMLSAVLPEKFQLPQFASTPTIPLGSAETNAADAARKFVDDLNVPPQLMLPPHVVNVPPGGFPAPVPTPSVIPELPTALPSGPGIGNFGKQVMVNMGDPKSVKTMDVNTLQQLFPGKKLPKGMPMRMPETQPGTLALPPATELPPVFSGPGAANVPPSHPGKVFSGKQVVNVPKPDVLPEQFMGKPGPLGTAPPPVNALTAKTGVLNQGGQSLKQLVADDSAIVKQSLASTGKATPPHYESLTPEQKVKVWESGEVPAKKYTPGRTSGLKGVGVNFFERSRKTLNSMGIEGEQIVNHLDKAFNDYMDIRGPLNLQAKQLLKNIDKGEFPKLTRIIEGVEKGSYQQQLKAQQLKSILDTIEKNASEAVPGFSGIENYWTHRGTPEFYESLLTKKGQKSYTDWLRNKFPDASEDEIGNIVNRVMSKEKSFQFGPLVKSRQGLIPEKFLRRDPAVLFEYIDNASKYIADTKNLGKDSAYLHNLVGRILDPADQKFARAIVTQSQQVGQPVVGPDAVYRKARSAVSVMLLDHLTTVRNLMQRNNILGVEGLTPSKVAKSLASVYDDAAQDFAIESGILSPNKKSLFAQAGTGIEHEGFGSKYMGFLGHRKIEQGNRVASASAGRFLAEDMFKVLKKNPGDTFARSVLEDLGVDVDKVLKAGKLGKSDLFAAARTVTGDTQFFSNPLDLPKSWTNSEAARTLTHYAPAAYQQTVFLKKVLANAISNPKRAGLNALYLLAWMQVAGEAYNDLNAWIKGQDRPTNPLVRGVENMVPNMGYLADLIRGLSYDKGSAALSALGPVFGGAAEVASGVVQAAGGNTKPLLKAAARRVPLVGRALPQFLKSDKQGSSRSGGRTGGR